MCIECAMWVIYEFRRPSLYWEPKYGGKNMGEKLLWYPSKVSLIYVDLSEAYSTCYGWELRLISRKIAFLEAEIRAKKYFDLHVQFLYFCVDLKGT